MIKFKIFGLQKFVNLMMIMITVQQKHENAALKAHFYDMKLSLKFPLLDSRLFWGSNLGDNNSQIEF